MTKFSKKALKAAYIDGLRLGLTSSTRCKEPPTFKEWYKKTKDSLKKKAPCDHLWLSTLDADLVVRCALCKCAKPKE